MGLVFESAALDGVVLTGALLLALYLYFTRNFGYWRRRGVPYLPPTPFWGNVQDLFMLRFSIGDFLHHIYKELPDVPYVGFFIFNKPALLISSPELVKKVLVKDFSAFGDRYVNSDDKIDPIGHRNLFVIKGEMWKLLRMKLSPVFTSGNMKKMFHLVVKCDEQLVEYINNANRKEEGATIDVKEVTAKCTTDVISSCAFGINSNSLSDPNAEFRKFGRIIVDYTIIRALEVLVPFFVPTLAKFFKVRIFEKNASNFLQKVFWDTIKVRETSKVKRNDLIDLLLQLKNKGTIDEDANDDGKTSTEINGDANLAKQFDFSGVDLASHAVIFFAAGFETSASTMSFAFYELALHPDMQTRLRNEIRDGLKKNDGKITYEMIFSLKYLDMVVSETLRKYPTLPFLDRIAVRDYYVQETGLTIKKGTPIYISLHGLQSDPKYYPNPDRFDPERFSDKNKRSITPFTYMPFGEGPHNCIGMRFGLMSSKAGIVHVLAKYQVELSAQTPVPLVINKRGLVITTVGGIPLKFRNMED